MREVRAPDNRAGFNALIDNLRAEHGVRGPHRLSTQDAAALAAQPPADERDRQRGISREELTRYRALVEHEDGAARDAALV